MTNDTSDTTDITVSHAQDAAAAAQDRAGEVTAHAQDATHQVAGTAADQAQNVKAETVRQARNLAGEAAGQLSSQAKDQTQRLTATLRQLGDELKGMAEGGHSGGTATELAHQTSEKAHGLASYLDGKEPADILEDARGFARRRPGAFLAGAAVLGLLAGRVGRGVKDATSSDDHDGDGTGSARSSAALPSAGVLATDLAPVAGVSELPVEGLTSSTGHYDVQDPATGALVSEHSALSSHVLGDRGDF